jgi:hypothetical protein
MPILSSLALQALSIFPSSAEVERSFSYLKKRSSPQRTSFTEENLGIHLKIVFNRKEIQIPDEQED